MMPRSHTYLRRQLQFRVVCYPIQNSLMDRNKSSGLKVEKITDSNKELSFLTNFETKVIIYNKSRYFTGEQVVLPGKFVLFESMSKSDSDRNEKVLFFMHQIFSRVYPQIKEIFSLIQ